MHRYFVYIGIKTFFLVCIYIYVDMNMYIYIYIHTHMNKLRFIYIYIYKGCSKVLSLTQKDKYS